MSSSPADPSSPALEAVGLRKRYGARVAVDGISFSLRGGEILGLLGPNGAGKTTTLSLVGSRLAPDEGLVRVCGVELAEDARRVRSWLGLVPQEIALYPTLSARENLRLFGSVYGLSGETLHARIDELLRVVGLSTRANDAVGGLSGGMQRRVNLAASLVHSPRVLLLDEPTAGVDPQSRHFLLEHLMALRDQGTAILFSTHYMEEAERICDRIAILDAGRIVAEGTRADLLRRLGRGYAHATFAKADAAFDAGPMTLEETRLEAFRRMPNALRVVREGAGLRIDVLDSSALVAELARTALEGGLRVVSLTLSPPSLEALFLELTGHHFRDE